MSGMSLPEVRRHRITIKADFDDTGRYEETARSSGGGEFKLTSLASPERAKIRSLIDLHKIYHEKLSKNPEDLWSEACVISTNADLPAELQEEHPI